MLCLGHSSEGSHTLPSGSSDDVFPDTSKQRDTLGWEVTVTPGGTGSRQGGPAKAGQLC